MKKFIILFTLALGVVCAANKYTVTLFQPSVINGTQLKAGDYKIAVQDGKAIFKSGNTTFEAPVKVEDGAEKNSGNTIRYAEGGKIQEILIGGTHTKLVFGAGDMTDTPSVAK
jgi:hypothetical protein